MPIDLNDYRPNVGIILINSQNQVWIGERSDIKNAWQMPQGGIEEGDSEIETAYKELQEETGISKTEVTYIGITNEWISYNYPQKADPKEERGKIWLGQKQKWVLFKFIGDISNIDLKNATDKEFSQWKWQNWQKIIAEAVDFRKPSYKKAFACFPSYFY